MFECKECNVKLENKKDLIHHFWHKHRWNNFKTVLYFFYTTIRFLCVSVAAVKKLNFLENFRTIINLSEVINLESRIIMCLMVHIRRVWQKIKEMNENGTMVKNYTEESWKRVIESSIGLKRPHTEETKEKLSIHQKEWIKNNPDKKEEHNIRVRQTTSTEEFKQLKREQRIGWLKQNPYQQKTSKLETYFKSILDKLNIEYEHQYAFQGHMYDFKIKDTNIFVIKTDERKNKIIEDSDYTLIRFWEYDIMNNKVFIIDTLLEVL